MKPLLTTSERAWPQWSRLERGGVTTEFDRTLKRQQKPQWSRLERGGVTWTLDEWLRFRHLPQWSRLERGGVTVPPRGEAADANMAAMEPPRKRRSDGSYAEMVWPDPRPQWSRLERGGVTRCSASRKRRT